MTTLIPTPAHPATLASPRPALREGSRWLILLLVCTAQFMVVLDATVVNVALPSIKNGLLFAALDGHQAT